MLTIYSLIKTKVDAYINLELSTNQSVVGNVVKYIRKQNRLREPQREAIEVYLWLKFVAQNKKLSEIIRLGILFDETKARNYKYYPIFKDNYTTLFLSQFAQDNCLKNLMEQLLKDPKGQEHPWDEILDELLHSFDYPNYLFSLPMGAGKTYLMACFIYLDLYFANLAKRDKRFGHNFVVFAPQSSKTAILPSLQTIKNFDPEWILPAHEAQRLRQAIHIEILDSLSSQRKDKLQGNNPNLEKVNRISQTKDFGLVFITNAEKVVLERYDERDKIYIDSTGLFYDPKKASEIKRVNELRERLSQIPDLTVILDEVHHTYGKYEKEEKKLRQAVNVLNQHGNVTCVLGLSGTPYVRNTVRVGESQIRLNQIQDIVYNYSLSDGIGRFLKIPEVRSIRIRESQFVQKALEEFFSSYDTTYPNGTKSKIVFYCPTIRKLNEDILPFVQEWYGKNRKGKEQETFRYYSSVDKNNRQYQLPKENLAIFNNLDKPYSDKRVILLVAVGTEGWDCKSLTSVVLPRQKTSKNFVLQTTCRCLREVENAAKEKALIFLERGNYETLDKELKENYNLTIRDLKVSGIPSVPVKIRKPKLGRLRYKQIYKKFEIITKQGEPDYSEKLKEFKFALMKKKLSYDAQETKAEIGKKGLMRERVKDVEMKSELEYTFEDLLYDIAKHTYCKFSEITLFNEFGPELRRIYNEIGENLEWITFHPYLETSDVAKTIASCFMEEISYKSEIVQEDTEIELLEWNIKPAPSILFTEEKFLPDIKRDDIDRLMKRPNRLEEDFDDAGLDPYNMSFNYIPYKMGSDFERNALLDVLKQSELRGLEVYYNGYRDSNLDYFWIKTDYGRYTPDFLIIKRKGGQRYENNKRKAQMEKILIIETKGKIYYNTEFKNKEKYVKETFLTYNPKFRYHCFVDEERKNDFSRNLNKLKELVNTL